MDNLARFAETSENVRDTEAHFQIVSITEIDSEDELAAGELDALLASEKMVSTPWSEVRRNAIDIDT